MKYHFKIHRDPDGLWAECIELDGCHTQGDTEEELYKYMKEVLDLWLDEPEESEKINPLPKIKVNGKNIVEIPVDPEIAERLFKKHIKLTEERCEELKDEINYEQQEFKKRIESLKKPGKKIKAGPDNIFYNGEEYIRKEVRDMQLNQLDYLAEKASEKKDQLIKRLLNFIGRILKPGSN